MTQDKAPKWSTEQAAGLVPEGTPYALTRAIALALSQAYERGQESMRERAAGIAAKDGGLAVGGAGNMDFGPNVASRIARAIRSLPIEQEGGE